MNEADHNEDIQSLAGMTPNTVPYEVLQYAHENDLISPLERNSFTPLDLSDTPLCTTIRSTADGELTGCSHLEGLEIPAVPTRISWEISSVAPLRLLKDVSRVLSNEELKKLAREVSTIHNIRHLKLELPALRSDHDSDCREFQKGVLARQNVSLNDHRLPLEPLNVEEGEGLDFPTSARQQGEVLIKTLENEKMNVQKETLLYLAKQMKSDWSQKDMLRFLVDDLTYEKGSTTLNPALEPFTPPISPKLEPKYFIPSSQACEIPVPSEPDSLLSDDLKAIEDQLFEAHGDVWSPQTSPMLESVEAFNSETLSPVVEHDCLNPMRPRLEDLKMDLPLLPDANQGVQLPKAGPTGFKDMVAEMQLDHEEHPLAEDFKPSELEEQLKETAEATMRSIEQEQLQEVDAIARVPVPVMNFSITEPEWTKLRQSSRAILKWIREGNVQLFKLAKWPKDKRTESTMVWNPFRTGATSISETEQWDGDDSTIETFITSLADVDIPTSFDFVAKRDGLVALKDDDEEDEDEIQPLLTKAKPQHDLMAIVKKKRSLQVDPIGQKPEKREHPTSKLLLPQAMESEDNALLIGNSSGASGKLLANFMDLHAPKKRKLTHSKFFPAPKGQPLPSSPDDKSGGSSSTAVQTKAETQVHMQAEPLPTPPCPTLHPPPHPVVLIISLQIPRRMIRMLDNLVPKLTLFERDYHAHNASVWRPGSVTRTEVIPPLADDADINISPSTGILLTSMIKVRQKPLPGAISKSALRCRVEKVSRRYERLIILVTEGSQSDTVSPMSSSDSAAFSEFQGFVGSLDENVSAFYVGGGEEALAKWVASFACQHCHEAFQVQHFLMDKETYWELLLRRAGVNVYAAQAILGLSKTPDSDTDAAKSGQYGLPGFVRIPLDKKIERFGDLVGRKVLERVSKTLDGTWA